MKDVFIIKQRKILDQYIHIVRAHDSETVKRALEDCHCKKYNKRNRETTRRRAIIEQDYLSRLFGDIHCYMYHNQENSKDGEIVEDPDYKESDDEIKDDSLSAYEYKAFVDYNLMTPTRWQS